MRGLIILLYISKKTAAELIEGVEVPHIQGRHPLVFHRAEPAFDLGLPSRGVRLAVT